VPKQFHVVEVLAGSTVSIVSAKNEGASVESPILDPSMVESFAKTLFN
jgi:hypothetical protein